MGQSILVIAESGAGKSTSIESLDSKETVIINVADKPLPFKGWKNSYKPWSITENPKGNLYTSSDPSKIEKFMHYVSEEMPHIKNLVIDDFQYMSSFEFFDRMSEKGFEKFNSIGSSIAKISRTPIKLRGDLMVFFLTHAEESQDLEGRRKYKAKTVGKVVDNVLTLEGLFTVVLFGKAKKKDGAIKYVFETQTNGDTTAKSPRGMFSSFEIDNNLADVRKAILDYEV
jgi:hypothetical protein